MERNLQRAWRRAQTKRKWLSRLHKLYFYYGYNTSEFREKKKYESWKDLLSVKWCKKYKDTGRPCSCSLCTAERYSRLEFSRETNRIIHEELND